MNKVKQFVQQHNTALSLSVLALVVCSMSLVVLAH